MSNYISDCGFCHETQFTGWYSKNAPRDMYGRIDRDYCDGRPVAYCSEEHRDAADALIDAQRAEILNSDPEMQRLRAESLGRKAAIGEAVARTRRELLGDDLNPSRLVLDAQSYRELADDVLATMPDPDRWDIDGAEPWVLAQYVKHLAAQVTLAAEFRVPLPDGLGGYGELVVQRESAGSDRWAVTDGAVSGLRAWLDPDGWQYVAEIGRTEAFAYGLDEALDMAEDVARLERERHDARIASNRAGGES